VLLILWKTTSCLLQSRDAQKSPFSVWSWVQIANVRRSAREPVISYITIELYDL
jgi:hypothetical protein